MTASGRDPRVGPGRAQPQRAPALPWVLPFPGTLERSSDFRPLLFRTKQLFLNKSSVLFTLCHVELKIGVFWFALPSVKCISHSFKKKQSHLRFKISPSTPSVQSA